MVAPTTAARLVREVEEIVSRTPWGPLVTVKWDMRYWAVVIEAKMPNLAKKGEVAEFRTGISVEVLEMAHPSLMSSMVDNTLDKMAQAFLHQFLTDHIRGQVADPRTY